MKEFEIKILDVNTDEIDGKLLQLGAKKGKEQLMRRWVFDINPEKEEWIRLRDDGRKTTITYKKRTGVGVGDCEEIEVEVKDLEAAAQIFENFVTGKRYYQENKRTTYKLKGMTFTIDIWPKLPAYLEIEAGSEKKVRQGQKLLGMEGKDIGNASVKDVYNHYGIDLHSFPKLTF